MDQKISKFMLLYILYIAKKEQCEKNKIFILLIYKREDILHKKAVVTL